MADIEPKQRTLGLVLGADPSAAGTRVALRLAGCALDQGIAVKIFLIGDGLAIALATQSNKAPFRAFRALLQRGAEVTLCSVMLRDRGIPGAAVSTQVTQGSLLYFAEMVQSCERLLYLD